MKRLRRLLVAGAVLCLSMVLLLPFIVVGAEGAVTVSIDAPAEVDGGTDFTARVNITEVTDFDAANYDITYNPLILEVTDVTDGIIGETVIPVDMWDFVPAETQGTIRVIQNVPGLSGVSGSGYLAKIHFHVVGSAGNTSDIILSNGVMSNTTATEIPATWLGDSVHVAGAPGPGGGGGSGGGGGGPAPTPKLKVDMMGKVSSVPMTKEGVLEDAMEATSTDGAVTLHFAQGARMLDSEGDCLEKITVDPISEPPEPPENAHIIGLAYDFGPEGAAFDPEIELTVRYDVESLPDGVNEEDLVIAYYNSDSEEWVLLPSVVDTGAHAVTVSIGHFTLFAIVGREEACFDFADLLISPTSVDPDESVTISAKVTNTGGLEGSYTVKLLIDGVEEATQELTVAPGATDTVTFTVIRETSGTYSVEVEGLVGEFTVTASPFPWAWLSGIIAAPVVAAITLSLIIWRRRRAAQLSEG